MFTVSGLEIQRYVYIFENQLSTIEMIFQGINQNIMILAICRKVINNSCEHRFIVSNF